MGWGFNRFKRGYLHRWGESRQYHEGLRIQHLQQALGAAKELKLLGRESEFLNQYWLHNYGSARVGQLSTILNSIPRLWLELLVVIGLAVLVLIMINQGSTPEAILPTIGLFAAASFRIMPSINRLISAVQVIRFSLPVINTLHSELNLPRTTLVPKNDQLIPFGKILNINSVCFRYPSTETFAIKDVSLSIPQGALIGFIGGSGAGKSTLVDLILGLLTPVSGVIQVDGIDIQKDLRGWEDQIGYVPQSIFLTDDSLRSNIAFGLSADKINEDAVRNAICSAQLEQFVSSLPQGLDTLVGERGVRISGGQRQRIGIARALYHDPSVLVLDEATSSLDTTTELDIMKSVSSLRNKKTILIVTHRLSPGPPAVKVGAPGTGQIVARGTPI